MIRLRGPLAALVAALLWAVVSLAQTSEPPVDYTEWENVARRAESSIERGSASIEAFTDLRNEIADWRRQFLAAETANQARITTIRNQLSALGPEPAEGETEPEEIATRRAELEGQLERLQAPQVAANEAYNRADGLIGELDRLIRERDTNRILELGPSPLNPALWPEAIDLATGRAKQMGREVQRAWSSPTIRAGAREGLPLTLFLSVVGLTLFARGRRWMERATEAVQKRRSAVGRAALGFLVSLGQIALPVMGLLALSTAATTTGLLGIRTRAVVELLPVVGFFVYGALWLGRRIFPQGAAAGPLDLPEGVRGEGRRLSFFLGVLIGIAIVFGTVFDMDSPVDEAAVVWALPLLVAMGYALFRLGRFLSRTARRGEDGVPQEAGFRTQMVRLLGRVAMLFGLLGPVAAAVGYENLSAQMVFPASVSLALIGTLAALHVPIRDIYAVASGRAPEDAGEALIPVLVSFILAVASLPLFALIWGVRPTELSELWARFLAGFTIGETRLSPADFLTVAIVFAIGYTLTRLVQGTLRTTVLPRTGLDIGGRNAIVAGTGYVGLMLAAVIAITTAGINLTSLAFIASALAVGVGFGLQNIVSNFVSGIILLIERPISEGDWIEVGGQMGYVRAISVRSTRIETFDRTDVIVPNADFVSGTVINYTRGNLIGRVIVPVGVAYGTDTRKVEAILREIAEAHPMVMLNPKPNVIFMGFGADSLDFEIRAILRDVNWVLSVKSDMNHEIARRFAEAGIEIPFAQRDIWLRNPEALRAGASDAEESET